MYQDRDEELNRLCEELLEEEQPAPQPAAESPVIYRNFANNYGGDLRNFASSYTAYNADSTDDDPQELADELLEEPEKEVLWPFVAVDLLLLGGIFGVLAYWIFGMGMFG